MAESAPAPKSLTQRMLDRIEWAGNKLPDPAVLFVWGLLATWVASALLAGTEFSVSAGADPMRVENQLTAPALAGFLAGMVETFTGFHPLGVVLVALLGVGVAEAAGFIDACIKGVLAVVNLVERILRGLFWRGLREGALLRFLLTPVVIFVGIVSHIAADAGYVLVIPLGGVIFYAAGRHPLAGIGAAFAGVSGGFSANFVPSGIDPLLSGLTQTGVDVLDPTHAVNPLCNWAFTSASCLVIILLGWFLTDRVIEPRLAGTAVDGDPEEMPELATLETREVIACLVALGVMLLLAVGLLLWALPWDSALRAPIEEGATAGSLTSYRPMAPLMGMLVPLIFIFFLVPGIVYGYLAGTFETHRDVIKGMSKAMGTMAYYLVMVFFAALFIDAFNRSNIGALLAVTGANFLRSLGTPSMVTIVGIILLSSSVNLLVGSASAKWALLAPIFVPMLMQLGISPELTQAAYRVGDSTTNIITPMMPYFPLVVVFAQRYVKQTGIGTITSLMLPYSIVFLIVWTVFLLVYWQLGLPLGIAAEYDYQLPVNPGQ